MPRAGSGGGHSSSPRSSGGHSSSRSSGGHRISSSGSHSRAGSRRSGPSFHGTPPPPPRGPGMPPPPPPRGPSMPPPPPSRYRRRSYRRTNYSRSTFGSFFSTIVILLIIFVLFTLISTYHSVSSRYGKPSTSSITASTRNREKLNSGLSFDSNCIIDELDWFDSVSKAGKQLKTFYDKTGVQPYIVLLKHHPELITDSQKEDYAQEYYEEHIDNEATFLYMYFAEQDQDNDVGYMCYVNGKQVDSVMDTEAVDIFWGYLDRNWYSDMSTDTLFADAFNMTATTIMTKTPSKTNRVPIVIVGIVIIGVIIAVGTIVKAKRRNG